MNNKTTMGCCEEGKCRKLLMRLWTPAHRYDIGILSIL